MRYKTMAVFSGGFLGGIAFTILLFLAVLPALNKYAKGRADENLDAPVLPTADADFGWMLTALDGSETPLAQYKGKTIVMTIWDPDCAVCLAELPYLQILSEKIKDDDIAFVAVSTKRKENMSEILDENGVSFPVFTYLDKDARPGVFKVGSVPVTFVISPAGKVVLRYKGGARWDDDSFVRYLREVDLMASSEPEKQAGAEEER